MLRYLLGIDIHPVRVDQITCLRALTGMDATAAKPSSDAVQGVDRSMMSQRIRFKE